METPQPPSDKELQEPIGERGDEAYQTLANEASRRVWTVLSNLIEVRSRPTKGVLVGEEVQCIFMGAISGIAMIAARMDIQAPEGAEIPGEVALLNDLGNQFMNTIGQMRESDPVAKAMWETRQAAGTQAS